MFRVKICGITNVEDARLVAEAGADAVGLNFYPKSPRCIDLATARRIIEALGPGIAKIGLFVNASVEHIWATATELQLDMIQLHGDEPPAMLAELRSFPILRAFRLGADGFALPMKYLKECEKLGCRPAAVLFDTAAPGVYGGSGQIGNWTLLSHYTEIAEHPPMVLAGGLNPENVADAIRVVRPYAVDTASGVEINPRQKSAEMVRAFVAAAKQSFADFSPGTP